MIMKTLKNVILISLLFSIGACALENEKRIVESSPSEKIFAKAEDDFSKGEYALALKGYSDYMYKFPDQPSAPAALYKIGAIYASRANQDRARQSYQEIVKSYPQSPYYKDAMMEILASYYREKRYSDVIRSGKTVPDNLNPPDYLMRKYT